MKLEAVANQLFQRGHDALPLAQQVSSLEKKVAAKIKEAETIRGQLASLNLRLEAICGEGVALEQQLGLAKAKLAAAPAPSCPPPAASPLSMPAVMDFMRHLSGMLPPEMGGAFSTCLDHIQRGSAVEAVEEEPAPMEVGFSPLAGAHALSAASANFPLPLPSLPPPGRSGDAISAPAPLASAAGLGAAVVAAEVAVGPSPLIVAPVAGSAVAGSQSSFGPARERVSGSSSRVAPFPEGRDGEEDSYLSVRSRTHPPGTRMTGKAPSSDHGDRAEDVAAAFIRDGKRYFPRMPRGLDWAVRPPPSWRSW